MTTTTPDPIKLRKLDEDMRQAWNVYRERTHELDGLEYELAEDESWTLLQGELRRLERRRRRLSTTAAKAA